MFGISTCMYHLALDNHLMCPFLGTITSSAPRFPQFPRGLCGVEVSWTFPHPLWHIQWCHDAYLKEEGPWCLWITLGGERWASEKKKQDTWKPFDIPSMTFSLNYSQHAKVLCIGISFAETQSSKFQMLFYLFNRYKCEMFWVLIRFWGKDSKMIFNIESLSSYQ